MAKVKIVFSREADSVFQTALGHKKRRHPDVPLGCWVHKQQGNDVTQEELERRRSSA